MNKRRSHSWSDLRQNYSSRCVEVGDLSTPSRPQNVVSEKCKDADILRQTKSYEDFSFESDLYVMKTADSWLSCRPSEIPLVRARRNAIDFSPISVTNYRASNSSECDRDLLRNDSIASCSADGGLLRNNASRSSVTHSASCVTDVDCVKDIAARKANGSLCGTSDTDQSLVYSGDVINVGKPKDEERCIEEMKHRWYSSKKKSLSEKDVYCIFMKTCLSLRGLSENTIMETKLAKSASLTFPNPALTSRPITARHLTLQLECCYAYIHGGSDLCDAPIICLPHYPALHEVSNEDFHDVILYLTSITSACSADVGFVLIVDRRQDKWSSLRGVLVRIAGFFPGFLRMVLVLKPSGFLQGTISDIGFRWQREEFKMKVTMISNSDELFTYINPHQLTKEFGGDFIYDHSKWIKNRLLIEDFTAHATEVGRSLEIYGGKLTEEELPNDVSSTEKLIQFQKDLTSAHKVQLNELLKDAIHLKDSIETPQNDKEAADEDILSEVDTCQSILSLVEETDIAFERFWLKHEKKLNQCLLLRQFEQDYREAKAKLDIISMWIEGQSETFGTSISWVESLIREHESTLENFQSCEEKCNLLSSSGEALIENGHYAVDCIAPKCEELRRISTQLRKSMEHRIELLNKSLLVLTRIEEINVWCEKGMTLLAGQVLEKTQTYDGAQRALVELDSFFEEKDEIPLSFENSSHTDLQEVIKTVESRLDEVTELYKKRKASLKKVTTRHGNRPVQLVEPSKKSKPSTQAMNNRVKSEKSDEKRELTFHNNSTAEGRKTPPIPAHKTNPVDHTSLKLRHVMNELLATERVYVDELRSVVEGYGRVIDDEQYADLVPESLKGRKSVLLGNMEDIYDFHGKTFLSDLEECKEEPTSVGMCFIKRKENFNIYCQYCQNSARSDQLRAQIGEKHPFFLDCQQRLGHRLPLSAYLLKPVQRITKYQLILQQMLKHSAGHVKELQVAVQTMLAVLKSVNDSMHQTAIFGYQSELESLGQLRMQGSFSIQVDHKKARVKNLTRSRFSKPLHRHLFLYEKEILFCKQQNVDHTTLNEHNPSSNNSGQGALMPGSAKGQIYLFKTSLKMNAAGITETMKNDPCKFEIWYQGREEVYTILAPSVAVKQDWVKEIKKVLASQPKSEKTPPQPHSAEENRATKVKRSQSLTRKVKSAPYKSARQTAKSEKHSESKKKSTLSRSASMGKGKDRIFKRKNTDVSFNKLSTDLLNGKDVTSTKNNIDEKSQSLPRFLESPQCISDTEETSDNSTTGTSSGSCKLVVMRDRSKTFDDGEVILHIGNVAEIIDRGKEGWVKVRIDESGSEGWAPISHMATLSDASSFESVSSFVST